MLKTPERRGVALGLAAALAILALTLLSAKANSAPAGINVLAKASPAPEVVLKDQGDDDNDPRDPEILTFSTVGDSRQDPVSPDPSQLPVSAQDQIWLENTKAFSRILDTVHDQKAQIFFFNGDMIMGYGKAGSPANTSVATVAASDLMSFYKEYGFWRGMVSRTMENGIYVCPVPGNHETQWKHKVSGVTVKEAVVENENAWRANMGDLILDSARFTSLFGDAPTSPSGTPIPLVGPPPGLPPGAADGLVTDQTQLSYSFDFRGIHFVVINTDPVGKDAHAPTNWLLADLDAAQARGVIRSFVFGHKPAFTYDYLVHTGVPPVPPPVAAAGLDNDVPARDAFWDVIASHRATYICGHEHIFHISLNDSVHSGSAYQILVGSGGSPFEVGPGIPTINPDTDRDYAWATVKVYRSGKVQITAYGFDEHYGPTHVIQKVTIH